MTEKKKEKGFVLLIHHTCKSCFTYLVQDLLKLQEENLSLRSQVQNLSISHGKRLEILEVMSDVIAHCPKEEMSDVMP